MYTALEDIKIDKIDFDWIKGTTKISHLKRAIRVIELDGNYYTQLKDACYKRMQQIDPALKRIVVSNHISSETKQQLTNQLLQWQKTLDSKQKTNKQNLHKEKDLDNLQTYFSKQNQSNNIERKKKLAQSERIKGNQAIKSKDFQQSITYYTSSISLDPTMHLSYCNRALAYLKTKQYQKCLQDCQQTIKLDKTYVKAYHRKAKALIGLNNKVQAYKALQDGQKLEPENVQLTKQLKELREQMSPQEITALDSHLIPSSQFRKITIQEDSQQDD